MTNQQKTILFWLGTALGVVVIVFFLVTIQQKREMGFIGNQISFTGEGKISEKPELAIAEFAIMTSGKTAKIAQDANTARSKKVYDFLKQQGIEEKDIKTTYYNLSEQYASSPIPYPRALPPSVYSEIQIAPDIAPYPISEPKIIGYQVNQSYEVKIRDLEKVSAVVDGLVSAGANNVQNVRFDFEDRDKFLTEAREAAIEDAKEKAEELEEQLDIRLGRIINYYDNSGGFGYGKGYAQFSGEEGYGGGGPVLPPGENELTVQVTLTYQIK